MKRYIGFEIKSLDNMITRKILLNIKEKKDDYLTPVQTEIIKYLYFNDDKEIYQKDIEKKIAIRRSTVSGILKTMEKKKMITRIDSNTDMRVKRIILTEETKKQIKKIEKQTEIFEKQLRANISEENLEIFFSIIDKIKNNLSK